MIIKNYTAAELEKLRDFRERYLAMFPDAKLNAAEFYTYHPAMEEGKNVFCVLAGETLLGFAPLFAAPLDEDDDSDNPHNIWTIVIADPNCDDADAVREALLTATLARAEELQQGFPAGHKVRLGMDMMVSQKPDIDFALHNGFACFEKLYIMQRDLTAPLQDFPVPEGVTLRQWKMETEAEQEAYIAAFNRCFPAHPKSREDLQYFLQSPGWSVGTTISAFDAGENLIASVLSYWDPETRHGITDDVFVLPEWRGRGLAKAVVSVGLTYQCEHGVAQAALEVLANNPPALNVYQANGYTIVNEEVLVGRYIREKGTVTL